MAAGKGISYPKVYGLFSGGKDSAVTCDVLDQAGKLEAAVALRTRLCTPDWEEFVRAFCDERKWSLEFYDTTESYERLVLKYGFPGPTKHSWFMRYLKGRAIVQFKKYRPGAILASGVRTDESVKRLGNVKPVGMWEGVPILAPIFDWTTEETWAHFYSRGFERSPAYSTLQISGDCLCGAYAREGEYEALKFHYPEMGAYLDSIGDAIKEKHPGRCKWGWGWQQPIKAKTGGEQFICVECGPRDDLFPETLVASQTVVSPQP